MNYYLFRVGKVAKNLQRPFMKTAEEGSEPVVWAATSVEIVPEGYQVSTWECQDQPLF